MAGPQRGARIRNGIAVRTSAAAGTPCWVVRSALPASLPLPVFDRRTGDLAKTDRTVLSCPDAERNAGEPDDRCTTDEGLSATCLETPRLRAGASQFRGARR